VPEDLASSATREMMTNFFRTDQLPRRRGSAATVFYGGISVNWVSLCVDPVKEAVRVDGAHGGVGAIADLDLPSAKSRLAHGGTLGA